MEAASASRDPKPNRQLRRERELRGWSQRKVADEIGTNIDTVSKWERGINIPDPHFREKLCALFGRNALEFGFIEAQVASLSHNDQEMTLEADRVEGALIPARFLSMENEELINRYISEKDNFLELKTDAIEWTIPEVVVFDNTKRCLPINAINVQVDRSCKEYEIPAKIAGRAEDILEEIERYFYDSTTIRLNKIENNDHGITLTVTKAHYLQFVATNYAMDVVLPQKGWTRSLRDVVHPNTQLCQLEESLLCNHIGVGVLVFTLDNYLVIPVRSKENIATWQQSIGPSIAGATSYDDDMWSLKAGPVASWMREGREELGLENSDFLEENDVFLGITRDLLRGGKPDMYFATQLNITRKKLEQKFNKARDKWESTELRWLEFTNPLIPPSTVQERLTFLHEFTNLLNLHQSQLSRPAQTNFTFWFKYMMS